MGDRERGEIEGGGGGKGGCKCKGRRVGRCGGRVKGWEGLGMSGGWY